MNYTDEDIRNLLIDSKITTLEICERNLKTLNRYNENNKIQRIAKYFHIIEMIKGLEASCRNIEEIGNHFNIPQSLKDEYQRLVDKYQVELVIFESKYRLN